MKRQGRPGKGWGEVWKVGGRVHSGRFCLKGEGSCREAGCAPGCPNAGLGRPFFPVPPGCCSRTGLGSGGSPALPRKCWGWACCVSGPGLARPQGLM